MPNGWVGNPDEYLELLRDASQEIRAIDPKLTVLNGGCFTIGKDSKHDLNPDMQSRVIREGQAAFDVHATFDTKPELLLGPLADLRKEFKTSKPLWVPRVEQRGATTDELVRRVLSVKGCGASAFVWMWALSFDSGWRGLLTPMSSWKSKDCKSLNQHSYFQITLAGCAYVHAIGLLWMLPSNEPLDIGKAGQWLFAFADPSQKDPLQVVGLWLDEKMPDATLSLRVGTKATYNLLDLYGHAKPVAVNAGGTVSVPIKRTSSYLLVTNGEAVTTVRD